MYRRLDGTKGDCKSRDYIFSKEKERKLISCVRVFFCNHRTVSADKRAELVSERISCIALRGRCINVIVLNWHAPGQEKSDDSKHTFYEELQQVFDSFPKCPMKYG